MVFQDAFVFAGVVPTCLFAALVHPQFSDDDIVCGCCYPVEAVVLFIVFEVDVMEADWGH